MSTSSANISDYTVRRLREEDAVGVNACVRAIYGQSYIHDELYHPQQLLRMNQSGELVSVVALDSARQVVGHYALERPGLRPVAEGGEAMVLPEHRHHALMEQMRSLLETEAQRLELRGLYGHAVTNHVFSQRSDERFGEHPCAISLGWSPKSFHNMDQALSQRMSDVLYFKYLQRPEQAIANLPPRHREICGQLYGQLGLPIAPAAAASSSASAEPSAIDVDYRACLGRAVIHVRSASESTHAEIAQAKARLVQQKAEAIFLELPLAQTGTPALCEQAHELGFFFSGLGPSFAADGDALRLQWLADDLDSSQIQLESAISRALLAYVDRDRARVARSAT